MNKNTTNERAITDRKGAARIDKFDKIEELLHAVVRNVNCFQFLQLVQLRRYKKHGEHTLRHSPDSAANTIPFSSGKPRRFPASEIDCRLTNAEKSTVSRLQFARLSRVTCAGALSCRWRSSTVVKRKSSRSRVSFAGQYSMISSSVISLSSICTSAQCFSRNRPVFLMISLRREEAENWLPSNPMPHSVFLLSTSA